MKTKTRKVANLILFVAGFLVIERSEVYAEVSPYRAYAQELPASYTFYHEAIDRQYVIKAGVRVAKFIDQDSIVIDFPRGSDRVVEFYDRGKLTDDSYVDVSGRKLPLTCIWLHGQTNISKGKSHTFLRRMILVINDTDCTGPVTELREDRWDSYLELLIFDPITPSLKEGKIVLNGSNLALGLDPLEWSRLQLAGGM